MVFVLMAGDATMSVLLASTQAPMVGFVMIDLFSNGTYPLLAAMGVTISLTATAVGISALALSRVKLPGVVTPVGRTGTDSRKARMSISIGPDGGGPAPLCDLTVLEITGQLAGSFTGAILGDLGADVIRLEGLGETLGPECPLTGTARDAHDIAYQRNKRSVALDLDGAAGRRVLDALVRRADVLVIEIDAHLPDTLQRLGLDEPILREVHPDLVQCRISGFGSSESNGHDLVIQALSGCMDLTGDAGKPPFPMGIPLCDQGAAIYAAIGVVGAVATGQPRTVDIAKLDVAVALLSYMGVGYFADGEVPTRVGTGHSTIFPYNAFRALDGEVVVAPFTGRFWRNFCSAVGADHLLEVEEYRNFAGRVRHKARLSEVLEPILAVRTVAEWIEVFRAADVPAGPVLDVAGALELEQTAARGMTPEVELAPGQRVRTAGSPFRIRYSDGTTYRPQSRRPPDPGEHTAEVLAAAGIPWEGSR